MAFFGATATVTVTGANQVVAVSGTTDLGSSGPATGLHLDLCYQGSGTGFVAEGLWFGPLTSAGGSRMPYSLTRSFQPQPDTYTVGLCGCIAGSDPWLADFSTVSVELLQK